MPFVGYADQGDRYTFRTDDGRDVMVAKTPDSYWAAKGLDMRLAEKRRCRARDEAEKPLAAYREEELAHMRRNFYGFDPSYHVARHHFVRKSPASWTPRHLARHRDLGWQG